MRSQKREIGALSHHHLKRLQLQDKSRVLVLGGGPAGAFFAIHLIREAKAAHIDIIVTIVDKKVGRGPGSMAGFPRGCNYCAGIISPRLDTAMEEIGIVMPDPLKCEKFSHIWIHGLWKNFPLKLPSGQSMYAVFRGDLPHDKKGTTQGFDAFLLNQARRLGAAVIESEVVSIRAGPDGRPWVTMVEASGKKTMVEADFAAIATGINAFRDANRKDTNREDNFVFNSFRQINPLFTPPGKRRTMIFELKPGRGYLKKYMHKEIYFVVSGSKNLRLDHISLVPKEDYLTVALVGDSIDRASFPQDTKKIIAEFFRLPQIRTILPHVTLRNTPVSCNCAPFMVSAPARGGIWDRMAVVGDALGSRLYRDGLFSAFVSARTLAQTVIHRGVDKKSLSQGYDGVIQWLETDNRYARCVMALAHAALKSPVLSRILYQAFATEMKCQEKEKWYLGQVLLNLGSCSKDYVDIFFELIKAPVLFSLSRGGIKTVRNKLTELFFGLKWENHGRYPTVIIKEKRGYFKSAIAEPLGITLDLSPGMERMYAIKIRAPSRIIFEELGRFGAPGARFLNLRFLDVRRISGRANEAGAVVRYSLKGLPVRMDIRLSRSIPGRSLFYEPSELFSKNGKLIFDIAPTKDGNNRLVIYTAFDFKQGKGFFDRLFWRVFKGIFPDYAHDVVWNHAICMIKMEAEKRAVS